MIFNKDIIYGRIKDLKFGRAYDLRLMPLKTDIPSLPYKYAIYIYIKKIAQRKAHTYTFISMNS